MGVLRRLLVGTASLVALAASGFVAAQAQADWFDPNQPALANAQSAQRANVDPAAATRVLIEGGDRAEVAAPAVVRAYNRCEAVYAAVTTATQLEPAHAAEIANAVATVPTCPCTGENLWVRTRFDQRIRIERRDRTFQIVPPCACTSAIAQAAAAASPEHADDVLGATVATPRRAGAVVDSLGQIGSTDFGGAAAMVPLDEQRCGRDVEPGDEFALGERWQSSSADAALAAGTERCADQAGRDGEAEDSADSATALRLGGYVASGNDRALVLENPTGEPVDLADQQYQLEVYFPGTTEPGRRFGLTGEVPANGRFVLAGADSSAAVRQGADAVTPLARFGANDALVLRRGTEPPNCECASAAAAGVANAVAGTGATIEGQSGADGAAAGTPQLIATADRVGQVRPEQESDAAAWTSPLRTAPLAWARADGQCEGSRDPQAAFELAPVWLPDQSEPPPLSCETQPGALMMSSFRAAPPTDASDRVERSVTVANRTGAPVDLEEAGYVLEVYAGGEREPVDVLPLEGEIAHGAAFRVASEDSAAPDQVESELARKDLDAVVLRRLSALSTRMCTTQVYAALLQVGDTPIAIAAPPPPLADGEPRTDESAVDPNRGGDIASPN